MTREQGLYCEALTLDYLGCGVETVILWVGTAEVVRVDQNTDVVLRHTADVIGDVTVDGMGELQAVMTDWTAEFEP